LAYKKTDVNYSYCLIGCTVGGQRPQEKVGIVPNPLGVREARGYDSCAAGYCRSVAGFLPAFVPCMGVCMAAGGRRRSMDEIRTPLPIADYKKEPVVHAEVLQEKPSVEFYVRECYKRCESTYISSDADRKYCQLGCTLGGQRPVVKEGVVDADFSRLR
jgi:hypothetical protein